jgi:hypothetical protein
MRESAVERFLKRRCNETGHECWKFNRPGRRGAFDRIVPLKGGRVVWIETKATDLDLSPTQQREKLWLEALGHHAVCLNSTAAVETFVRAYLMRGSIDRSSHPCCAQKSPRGGT